MKQVYREIKEQLTPDRRTVNELLDRINGREPAVLKTSGMRWAALVPLTAVLGLVLLGGMLKLGSDNDIETKEISDTNSVVEQQIKEYGYPAAQVETPVVVEDGKFDFQNGGYYSMEKHQPKDPPDEETKKRLLKQNLSISVMNGDPAYIVDDNASDDYVAFVDQDGHKW
ncbi:MAG: hypothetical protein IJ723_05370, partial [Ruminococcus sp.]|nr:hypothetical protein [Ruminococcus sp.]